ncbi:MAG: DUF2726 domain-containing protein [Betaproteobacteria bacterium]|nr:DUF2726 domain-containing protein [Betaproteobacteria bacterium]MCC6246806.1 DUF2726 domain-containing protein [Rubrivivax sp.]
MDQLALITPYALPAALLALVLLWAAMRWRQRSGRADDGRDGVDTVAGWPPEAARVLTVDERQAYEVLRRACPEHLVLAQVPLSRFVRVPLRRSYTEWLQRVGSLSADLLLCDASATVIAAIDIRSASESERARRRHDRMSRVLRHAGVHVLTWREGELPSVEEARTQLTPLLGDAPRPTISRPMPLIPVAEAEELAEDDRGFAATVYGPRVHEPAEPVPSDYFDDLDALPAKR